jgi:hypothetical protein
MFSALAVQRTRLFRDQKVDDIAACGRLCRFPGTEDWLRCLTETVMTDPVIEATIACIEEGGTISERLSGNACNTNRARENVGREAMSHHRPTQAARTGGFDAPADFLTFFCWKSGSGIRRP